MIVHYNILGFLAETAKIFLNYLKSQGGEWMWLEKKEEQEQKSMIWGLRLKKIKITGKVKVY